MASKLMRAGERIDRASVMLRQVGNQTYIADREHTPIGVAVNTALAGQWVAVELFDGLPKTIAVGGVIQAGDELERADGGVVVPRSSGALLGYALTPGSPPGTVTVAFASAALTTTVLRGEGEPEGVVTGEPGQIYAQLDADGKIVTLWIFGGNPGETNGWKSFAGF